MQKEQVGRLRDIIRGHMIMQSVAAIVRLRIPQLLLDKPHSVEDLACKTGAIQSRLLRVLKGLELAEIVRVNDTGLWDLQPMGELLASKKYGFSSLAAMNSDPYFWDKWSRCTDVLKGSGQNDCIVSGDPWENYDDNDHEFELFDQAMDNTIELMAQCIFDNLELSNHKKIIDVGGGSGSLVASLLNLNDNLEGVVTDRAATVEKSRKKYSALSDRLQWQACDFIRDPQPNGDIFILKDVLHNWNDTDALTILKNCRQAMSHESRLWIIENLYSQDFYWMDIHLMVSFDGAVRSYTDFQNLLRLGGLTINKTISISKDYTLLEILIDSN